MPIPRKYSDQAEKQKAYRERQAAARAAELARKGLPASSPVPTMPSRQRWAGLLAQAAAEVTTVYEEMHYYWQERTERWQESDRGEAMMAEIEALQDLSIAMDEAALRAKGELWTRS